jgi:hypothetical protein
MQLATSFFLPTFSKNHILRIQNAWFRRRPRIQAVTQQDDLPRSRDLGGGETPLKSGEFLGVFFLIEQSPSRSHGDFFRRNWGDEDLQIVRRWARNERNSDEKPPGGSDMSAPQSRGFFRFMKLYQTLIYEVAGGSDKLMMRFWVFLGFSGFFCADLSCGVWHPRSPGGALPCGKFGREAGPGEFCWVQGTWQIPCTSHTSNPFPVLFFFFSGLYTI